MEKAGMQNTQPNSARNVAVNTSGDTFNTELKLAEMELLLLSLFGSQRNYFCTVWESRSFLPSYARYVTNLFLLGSPLLQLTSKKTIKIFF